jgi:hypothetical protein
VIYFYARAYLVLYAITIAMYLAFFAVYHWKIGKAKGDTKINPINKWDSIFKMSTLIYYPT